MIKEVEAIPIAEKYTKVSRAGTVRDDIKTALDRNVPKFEFVGEIYTTCDGRYAADLGTSLVNECAWGVIRKFICSRIRENSGDIDKYYASSWSDVSDMFRVYKYTEEGRSRIFMELYLDKIDAVIRRYTKCRI